MNHHESREQRALIKWRNLRVKGATGPAALLKYLYAIPNGGKRDARTGHNLKLEGVFPGVFDLHLPVNTGFYHSLYIEMKYGKNKLTPEQEAFREHVIRQGSRAVVCYSWVEAKDKICEYLGIVG